jgi:hypothetical protein
MSIQPAFVLLLAATLSSENSKDPACKLLLLDDLLKSDKNKLPEYVREAAKKCKPTA